jgi:hypothetical protein
MGYSSMGYSSFDDPYVDRQETLHAQKLEQKYAKAYPGHDVDVQHGGDGLTVYASPKGQQEAQAKHWQERKDIMDQRSAAERSIKLGTGLGAAGSIGGAGLYEAGRMLDEGYFPRGRGVKALSHKPAVAALGIGVGLAGASYAAGTNTRRKLRAHDLNAPKDQTKQVARNVPYWEQTREGKAYVAKQHAAYYTRHVNGKTQRVKNTRGA